MLLRWRRKWDGGGNEEEDVSVDQEREKKIAIYCPFLFPSGFYTAMNFRTFPNYTKYKSALFCCSIMTLEAKKNIS